MSTWRGSGPGPGQRLGPYLLERPLGQGGMASVFVGVHHQTGARHAIKILQLGGDRAARRERFAREARALAKLGGHPGVVRIHDFGESQDGTCYCALDLVEGSDLEHALAAGRLPVERLLRLGEELARALAHVHAAGVVHRDLKPANVLLTGEDVPRLTDFGVARDESEDRLTLSRQVLGTPAYMAPEQIRGDRDRVGPGSDVFALGVILFEMALGERPFAGETVFALTHAVLNDPPPPLRGRRADLPRGLDELVRTMLDKEPEARPSAALVAEALGRLRRGESLPSEFSGSRLRHLAGQVVNPWRRLALPGALLAAVVAGGLALARHQAEQEGRLLAWRASVSDALGQAEALCREARPRWLRARCLGEGDPAAGRAELEAAERAARALLAAAPAGEDVSALGEAAGRLGLAAGRASLEAALAAGAREQVAAGLARLPEGPPGRILACLAAEEPAAARAERLQAAVRPSDPLAAEARLLAAALWLEEGEWERAQRALAGGLRVEPALAEVRAALEGRVLVLRLGAGGRALNAGAVQEALQAAREAPEEVRHQAVSAAAEAAVARRAEGAELGRVVALLDVLLAACGPEDLPEAVAPVLVEAAAACEARHDGPGLARRLRQAALAAPRRGEWFPDTLMSDWLSDSMAQLAGDTGNLRALEDFFLATPLSPRLSWGAVGGERLRTLYRAGVYERPFSPRLVPWVVPMWRGMSAKRVAGDGAPAAEAPGLNARALRDLDAALACPDLAPYLRSQVLYERFVVAQALEPGRWEEELAALDASGACDLMLYGEAAIEHYLYIGRREDAERWAERYLAVTKERIEQSETQSLPEMAEPISMRTLAMRDAWRLLLKALRRGDPARAEEALEQVRRWSPPTLANYEEAALRVAQGRYEEARAALEGLAPDSDVSQSDLDQLRARIAREEGQGE